jgi:hypothetical protein
MNKSWRDVIPVHPAAEFPMMTPDELITLGNDIMANGLKAPLIFWKASADSNLFLLDGCNRLDAMEAVGLSIEWNGKYEQIDWDGPGPYHDPMRILVGDGVDRFGNEGDPVDPFAYAASANIHRRHLTTDQKRDLITKLLKADPTKSNRQIAEQVKADHKTVGSVRDNLKATGEIPQLKKTTGKDGKARKQPIKKRELEATTGGAKKIITETVGDSTERQFAVLTNLWRMNNTLQAAWQRSNLKAQQRFIRWLDGGGVIDEEEAEAAS